MDTVAEVEPRSTVGSQLNHRCRTQKPPNTATSFRTRSATSVVALAGCTGVERVGGSDGELDPSRHGTLVEFDGPEGHDEVERYWVNAPFAYVSSPRPGPRRAPYQVVEPSLTDIERELLDRLFEDIRIPLIYRDDVDTDPERVLAEELEAGLRSTASSSNPRRSTACFITCFASSRATAASTL